MREKYIPTANEYIALPCLREKDAALESFSFLYMGHKGMLEVHGMPQTPLLAPFWQADGAPCQGALNWQRISHWVPSFKAKAGPLAVEGVYLAPVGERGFAIRLQVTNDSGEEKQVRFGLRGCWQGILHTVNESKPVEATLHAYHSLWNNGPVFDARCGTPLFAFSPLSRDEHESSFNTDDSGAIHYELARAAALAPGQSLVFTVSWGLGFEEVAATTSALEILRQSWSKELADTCAWLKARTHALPTPQLTTLYNTNLFFCLFFSTGRTLDTEELVLVTSRSPRYYVSAAYWDRDSLLWSFPAILSADTAHAREMPLYAFGRQRRNFGIHSRFIDGTVLEPGFELDELMAPLLALEKYIAKTGDNAILAHPHVTEGIHLLLRRLAQRKHPDVALFSTFLQPTDDEIVHPYLTYDNVLVWRALRMLEQLCPGQFHIPMPSETVCKGLLFLGHRFFPPALLCAYPPPNRPKSGAIPHSQSPRGPPPCKKNLRQRGALPLDGRF